MTNSPDAPRTRKPHPIRTRVERLLLSLPWARRRLDREYDRVLQNLASSVKPYRSVLEPHRRIPDSPVPHSTILSNIATIAERERERWRGGYVSGAVYNGNEEHIDLLNRVYALCSQTNPLHIDVWPSITHMESEIVSMTATMLGAGEAAPGVCGTVTSGGTESIMLAMKAYRDRERVRSRIHRPEIVVPVTAHAAFDKAAEAFGIRIVKIPVDSGFRADVGAARRAITRNTIAIVGSAPSFPHGVVDPINDLSELARQRGIGFHTDACLGGFVLPWARRLGLSVPAFDFNLPGVTSMSADTHKYGYAPKGSSVVLYRDPELRRHQYFTAAEWPGGLYFSPTFAGSRPGALSAGCWSAILAMGESGYLEATRRILETAAIVRTGIESIPELHILGDPLWVIAFGSETLDIYRVLEEMSRRSWSLNGLHHPPAIHLCVTLRHAESGVAQRFVRDLRESVAAVRDKPAAIGGMAPVYGMAATLPHRGVVGELLRRYVDLLYEP